VKSWDAPSAFKEMRLPKMQKDWKKVEANRALGYMKNSNSHKGKEEKGGA